VGEAPALLLCVLCPVLLLTPFITPGLSDLYVVAALATHAHRAWYGSLSYRLQSCFVPQATTTTTTGNEICSWQSGPRSRLFCFRPELGFGALHRILDPVSNYRITLIHELILSEAQLIDAEDFLFLRFLAFERTCKSYNKREARSIKANVTKLR
jgi:hypothetical protein